MMDRPTNSNNLYEYLVKNVMKSADDCYIMQNPSSTSSTCSSPPIFNGNLINIPGPLDRRKMDDGVWNEMKSPLSQAEMGTITLEEYLVQSGAVNPAGNQDCFHVQNTNPVPLMEKVDQDQMIIRQWQQQQSQDVPNPMTKMEVKHSSDEIKTDERMAKSVERRQRRMIKNRESAARSRARKQAYTNQLQNNVLQLQTTNNWLKNRKDINILLNSKSVYGTRYLLRRTSSIEF